MNGVTFSPEPMAVRFDEDSFWVDLEDGRTLGIPLAWFPRFYMAQRNSALWSNSAPMVCIGRNWTRISRLPGCWRGAGIRRWRGRRRLDARQLGRSVGQL